MTNWAFFAAGRRTGAVAVALVVILSACGAPAPEVIEPPVASSAGATRGISTTTVVPTPVSNNSIEGRWILESALVGDRRVPAEVGVNTDAEAWLEFTQTFEGSRDSFISGDGTGTAGTFVGYTGCNEVTGAGYEYSAGFLVLAPSVFDEGECQLSEVEQWMWALLSSTDGFEVLREPDRITLWGSNLLVQMRPLTFRREGQPPLPVEPEPAPETPALTPQVLDVEGTEVVALVENGALPDRATRIRFHTTIIDSGEGPKLCVGGVMDSLPPQCSGPIIDGLDMGAWSEEANGVRWGDRSVDVGWPPVDGHLELIADSDYEPPDGRNPLYDRPEECEGISRFAGVARVNEYAREIGGANGGLYLANDGTLVLQVVGDPEPHREELRSDSSEACVIEVPYSEAEQYEVMGPVRDLLESTPEWFGGGASTGPGGRVEIWLPVVDRETVMAILQQIDAAPAAVRFIGWGIVLADSGS